MPVEGDLIDLVYKIEMKMDMVVSDNALDFLQH